MLIYWIKRVFASTFSFTRINAIIWKKVNDLYAEKINAMGKWALRISTDTRKTNQKIFIHDLHKLKFNLL